MARLDASIFERFRVQLSETVRSDDVVQRLVQRAMLSHQDKNKINLATTNSQRMNLTINIITAKSAKAFDVFCDVIKFKYKNMHDQLMQAKMEPLINDKPGKTQLLYNSCQCHVSAGNVSIYILNFHEFVILGLKTFVKS